jgi:hypothetical protein
MEAPEEVVEREARDVATEEVAELVLPFQVHGRIRSGLVISSLSVFSSLSLSDLTCFSSLSRGRGCSLQGMEEDGM